MKCIHCGEPQSSRDAEICAACGKPIGSEVASIRAESSGRVSSSAAQGERRHATIWMSDLCGYTGLNEVCDPEQVAEVMDRIEGAATRIVEEHGGIVNQFVGDEIVALFGIPTAHEDDAQRAVSAALELHRFVRKLGDELGSKLPNVLRLHTGVHTGLLLA